MTEEVAEELFRQVSAFASFGFAKSHAAAFARTAYESSFLKLFYPAQFLVGLINAQPMGFYPVEVLVNDAKRHGVAVLPVDLNASRYKTTTEWVGRPGWATRTAMDEPLPEDAGIDAAARARPVAGLLHAVGRGARALGGRRAPSGWGVRLGLGLVKGIGEQHEALLDRELERGPYVSLADVVERTGLPEETIERLIRVGALDSLGRPRRELLWQLREVAGQRVPRRPCPRSGRRRGRWTSACRRPRRRHSPASPSRSGSAMPTRWSGSMPGGRSSRCTGRRSIGSAPSRTPPSPNVGQGPVRIGGLVVTRQHPMTAKGTVFLALEDETGMVNVTLWPDTWARLRGVVRRHALLLVDGDLQRERRSSTSSPEMSGRSSRSPSAPAPPISRTACASSATPGCAGSAEIAAATRLAAAGRSGGVRRRACRELSAGLPLAPRCRGRAGEREEALVPGRGRGEERPADGRQTSE